MAAVIANEFTEADNDTSSALIEIGLVLFIMTPSSTGCRGCSSGAWLVRPSGPPPEVVQATESAV